MPDSEQNLLGTIPTGDEIRDPREGIHPDAKISAVDIAERGSAYVLKLVFSGLIDSQGREFEYTESYTIPTSTSEDFIQRIFLALCHDTGVAPRSFKSRIMADTEQDRETIRSAFQQVVGNTTPMRITSDDKSGYLRSRILRGKPNKATA